jgi:hypothetical protein
VGLGRSASAPHECTNVRLRAPTQAHCGHSVHAKVREDFAASPTANHRLGLSRPRARNRSNKRATRCSSALSRDRRRSSGLRFPRLHQGSLIRRSPRRSPERPSSAYRGEAEPAVRAEAYPVVCRRRSLTPGTRPFGLCVHDRKRLGRRRGNPSSNGVHQRTATPVAVSQPYE